MRSFWVLLAGLLGLVAAWANAAEPALSHVNVYESGKDGYYAYRIPAIETAPDGSLLAFAEARKHNLGDPGTPNNDIDLVLKRSTDGGRTWSAMRVIEDSGELWSSANPATVVDRQTGRVWVHYLRCRPGRGSEKARPGTDDVRNLARHSDDNGLSWSEPVDLTSAARDMNDSNWRCSVPGPGGAIQDRKGRLLVPHWKVMPWGVLAVYSDDHGKTWKRGDCVPGDRGGNENQLVELADGRILMDYRQNDGPHRWLAVSGDGGQTWGKPRPGQKVTPVCCAIERLALRSAGGDRDRILWTGPKGPGRNHLVAWTSLDEAQTFTNPRVIANEPAAYSDLALLKDKAAGVLWERGNYKYITFTRLGRDFLDAAE